MSPVGEALHPGTRTRTRYLLPRAGDQSRAERTRCAGGSRRYAARQSATLGLSAMRPMNRLQWEQSIPRNAPL